MPYLLRLVVKAKWDPERLKEFPWLAPGALPADCLTDLRTQNNSLSLWEVSDDKTNLRDVVIALAAARDRTAHVDYALLQRDRVSGFGMLQKTRGRSPHMVANDRWHWELTQLSAMKLYEFAETIFEHASPERVPERAITVLIKAAIEDGRVSSDRMSESLRKSLDGFA